MFVFKSTYDKALRDSASANKTVLLYQQRYNKLLSEWNDLVTRVNRGDYSRTPAKQLESMDIKKLLMLCHPDKHGGKPMAEEMTKKLLSLRT